MTERITPEEAPAVVALRQVAERIRSSTDPDEVAALVEGLVRDGGALEALSDALATASRWVKDHPAGGFLWQPLSRAADEIWEAGADVANLPAEVCSLASRPGPVRSAAARITGNSPTSHAGSPTAPAAALAGSIPSTRGATR